MAASDDDLCIGDVIGLHSEDARGYVFSFQSSNAHNEIAIGRSQTPLSPGIECLHSIQFQVYAQNRYEANKKLRKINERLAADPSNAHLKAQVAQAKKFADAETADNEVEQFRQNGKPVYYGQIIQLRHIFTSKFVHVNTTQTSWSESSNLLVELLHENGSRAQFKVLPRYKVKSEGDVVQIGDLIVLESVKSQGQYLHCSIVAFNKSYGYHDSRELNLSVIQSGFSVHRSRNATARVQNDTIMGCSIVQLFHKEMEGYVAAEGVFGEKMLENIHLRVRPVTTTNHKSLLAPNSAITCWCIEKETELMNSTPIRWEEQIRLQHLTTRRYMMVTSDLKVTLSDTRDDPLTVFRFFPVSRLRNQTVRHKSFLRIQHVLTGAWLHGDRDLPYIRIEAPKDGQLTPLESVPWSRAPLRQLSGCAQMMYDDAFTIMLLDIPTVANMLYIAGMVPFLQQLRKEFSSADEFSPRQTFRTMSALLELKEFMLEFGVPIKSRQKLLRNFKVVDILVDLLKCGLWARPRAFVQKVHAECYDILQVYLQGLCPKNELYLAKHIEFFQHQLLQGGNVGLSATFMLMELLKDNRCIIDHITYDQMNFFIELIATKKNYRYLELLSVLCIAKGGTLPDNQTYIAKKWLHECLGKNQNVLDWLAMGEFIGRDRGVLYISHDMKSSWQPLVNFIAQKDSSTNDRYLFLEHQLRLFSSLCRGRNEYAIELITEILKVHSFAIAYNILTNELYPDELRAIAATNIRDLFVDVGENFPIMDRQKLVFLLAEMTAEGASRHKREGSILSTCVILPFIGQLKIWLSQFLLQNQSMIASEVARNHMIKQVLKLIYSLVDFGYYGDTDDIQKLLHPMCSLMDGRNDKPFLLKQETVISSDIQDEVKRYCASERFCKTAENEAVAEAKYQAMKVIELFFNFRFNTRLTRFITRFKNVIASGGNDCLAPFIDDDAEDREFRENQSLRRVALKAMNDLFKETAYFGKEFVDILLDFLQYEQEKVVTEALFLLTQYYSAFEDLFRKCIDTQLLLTDESCQVFANINCYLPHMKLLKKNKLSSDTVDRIVELLQDFTKMCCLKGNPRENHRVNQDIIFNCGILNDSFDLLQQVIGQDQVGLEKEHQLCVVKQTFRFLKAFSRGNEIVQNRLFDSCEFFTTINGADLEIGQALIEMFDNNISNCLKVSPDFIKKLARKYSETHDPIWLSVLASLVVADAFPIKRNQDIVIKALMTYQQSLAVITGTDVTTKLSILNDDSSEVPNADRQLGAHGRQQLCGLVHLFSLCAIGDNKSIESICQCLLTVDELLRYLNVSILCDGLRQPFVNFLTFGYINSTSETARNEIQKFGSDKRLIDFLRGSAHVLENATVLVEQDKQLALELLRHRPSSLHLSKSDTVHERKETLHYVFNGVLPMLYAIFERHWGASVPASAEIGGLLLDAVMNFAHTVHPLLNLPQHRTVLLSALQIISNATGLGVTIPAELNRRLSTTSDARQKYDQLFAEEVELNRRFDMFGMNLLKAYEGMNSVRHQLGLNNDSPYIDQTVEGELPLGEEFQQLVNSFHSSNKDTRKKHNYNVEGIVKHLSSSMKYTGLGERNRLNLLQLDVKCLQVLRAMIHNEQIRVPSQKQLNPTLFVKAVRDLKAVQQSLDKQNLVRAVLPHLARSDDQVVRECFNLLSILYKGNTETPETFVKHINQQHEEAFFVAVQSRLHAAASLIREKRFMLFLHQRAIHEFKSLTKAMEKLLARNQSPTAESTSAVRVRSSWSNVKVKKVLAGRSPRRSIQIPLNEIGETQSGSRTDQSKLISSRGIHSIPELRLNGLEVDEPLLGPRTPLSPLKADVPASSRPVEQLVGQPDFNVYNNFGTIRVILKTLSSLCDLEFTPAQNLMREQVHNVKSVNLVSELCNFLSLIYSNVDGEYIEIICEVLETMIQFIQGNCENQGAIFDCKVLDFLNHILRADSTEYANCTTDNLLRLKSSVARVIYVATEENQTRKAATCQSYMIMNVVNKDGVWLSAQQLLKAANGDSYDQSQRDRALNIAFTFHAIIRRAIDLGLYSIEAQDDSSWVFFNSRTMALELVKGDLLQRVYFRVTDQKALRKAVEDKMKWEIDRSSYGNKMRDFIAWIKDINEDIRLQRRIHGNRLGRFFVRQWKAFNYSVLLLTLLLNLLMLFTWKAGDHHKGFLWIYHDDMYNIYWRIGGVLHNFCTLSLIISYFLSNWAGFVSSRKSMARNIPRFWRRKFKTESDNRESSRESRASKLEVKLLGFATFYYQVFLMSSILGTIVSPVFFAFHLFQVVANNQLLVRVIRAVTLNGRSLLYVALLGVIVIYMYGLTAFLVLRDIVLNNQHFCDTLWQCTLTMFREGLIHRAMRFDYPIKGYSLEDVHDNSNMVVYGLKLIFDISFFIVILTIGLNVIFGIIVDTFRQLRDAKWRIEQDIETKCFSCGRDSYEFEQKGISFKYHSNVEHNMLAYVFFYVKLQDTPIEQLSHLQMFFSNMMKKEDYSFFPLNRAISLGDSEVDTSVERDLTMIGQLNSIIKKLNQENALRAREAQKIRQMEWEKTNRRAHDSAVSKSTTAGRFFNATTEGINL